jgi:hypothetical protein
MDIDKLEEKLNNINAKKDDTDLDGLIHKLKLMNDKYNIDNLEIKGYYYGTLTKYEKIYQIKNDKYKELISNFSEAYLEICDFYVGDNLPREHYLQSKKDIYELYLLMWIAAFAEPYLEAYHKKYCS